MANSSQRRKKQAENDPENSITTNDRQVAMARNPSSLFYCMLILIPSDVVSRQILLSDYNPHRRNVFIC